MRIVLVTSLLIATPAVADDAVVATLGSDTSDLVVYRVKAGGLDKIFTEKGSKYTELGWSDARTLWLLAPHETPTLVAKYLDGKIVEKITVSAATWKLPAGTDPSPKLQITKKGEVWLQHCLKTKGETGAAADICVKGAWVRVDTKTQTMQTRKPANINTATSAPFPRAKAPAGYSVTLKQVVVDGLGDDQKKMKARGAVCKGPSSSKTWPDETVDLPFAMKPSRVTWIRTSPPVAMIDGKATNPIGDIELHEAIFVGCKESYDAAMWFGRGAWGLRRDEKWTVYVEDKKVGAFESGLVYPAPIK
jgi:hypothetical protein